MDNEKFWLLMLGFVWQGTILLSALVFTACLGQRHDRCKLLLQWGPRVLDILKRESPLKVHLLFLHLAQGHPSAATDLVPRSRFTFLVLSTLEERGFIARGDGAYWIIAKGEDWLEHRASFQGFDS